MENMVVHNFAQGKFVCRKMKNMDVHNFLHEKIAYAETQYSRYETLT